VFQLKREFQKCLLECVFSNESRLLIAVSGVSLCRCCVQQWHVINGSKAQNVLMRFEALRLDVFEITEMPRKGVIKQMN
jgi:hypothetical protein